ncbi:50S ribosomal protein L9 [Entomospira culicis]|uniref:Large ribosomal subunit protein bL9 n=1 Tax=Entomospira culicis TaxID=2719989 RepID=A0A968GFJ9_9SPIO|nr:50S ribosomal protein L9 [Entomospira culicis]NIZ19424.1 50S ribosomal protein L9 [Entomospira culicis]NIZ69671.1 50S ribosomal protein L9 [Entomospira culicis]WDI36781.1 50S ribosomal protein L9 [Entomospira culicis]WDI38410.1 50S ribosomal protein L9 [Entomospira culicis]
MKMKVILKQDYASLGEEGDIKEVAAGYARNYLIPNGIVANYSAHAVNELTKRQHIIARKKAEKAKEARSHKEKLEAEALVFHFASGEKGRLFGAVTPATIAEELAKKGMSIEKKFIDIPNHSIKEVGEFEVKVRLYAGEVANLKINVQSNNPVQESAEANN